MHHRILESGFQYQAEYKKWKTWKRGIIGQPGIEEKDEEEEEEDEEKDEEEDEEEEDEDLRR